MKIGPVIVRRFTVGRYPINGYLLTDAETKTAAFIDPGGFHEEIADYIKKHAIQLRYLLFTHGHWDHTEGKSHFTARYDLTTFAGKGELSDPDHPIQGGETIELGQTAVKALPTPGHTPMGISYYCDGCLFSGDALFCGTVGGTATEQQARQQIDSVQKQLFTLPDKTIVFPAHGPFTSIAAEKHANPFFNNPTENPV